MIKCTLKDIHNLACNMFRTRYPIKTKISTLQPQVVVTYVDASNQVVSKEIQINKANEMLLQKVPIPYDVRYELFISLIYLLCSNSV